METTGLDYPIKKIEHLICQIEQAKMLRWLNTEGVFCPDKYYKVLDDLYGPKLLTDLIQEFDKDLTKGLGKLIADKGNYPLHRHANHPSETYAAGLILKLQVKLADDLHAIPKRLKSKTFLPEFKEIAKGRDEACVMKVPVICGSLAGLIEATDAGEIGKRAFLMEALLD